MLLVAVEVSMSRIPNTKLLLMSRSASFASSLCHQCMNVCVCVKWVNATGVVK